MKSLRSFVVLLVFTLSSALAGTPVLEFSVPGESAEQPQMASGADGMLYVVYGAGNTIYCSASSDGGEHFSPASTIKTGGFLSLGRHRGPRIAATATGAVITAIVGEAGHGRDGNLLSWHSVDRGKSWSQPVVVNDVPESAREGLHGMAAGSGGMAYAAWLDLRSTSEQDHGTKLFGSVSRDGGKTWGKNRLVYRSPDGTICQCCHPSVFVDSSGVIHVMWRNALNGSRDLYHLSSRDGGKSFTEAAKLGQGTWQLESCPMDGGDLAASPDGKVAGTWRREDKVYVSGLAGPETLLGSGKNPVIALTRKGRYLAWEDNVQKTTVVLVPGATRALPLGNEGQYAELAAAGRNVAAAWEERSGEHRVIKLQLLE